MGGGKDDWDGARLLSGCTVHWSRLIGCDHVISPAACDFLNVCGAKGCVPQFAGDLACFSNVTRARNQSRTPQFGSAEQTPHLTEERRRLVRDA